jgi:hypothetical protein
MTARKSSPCRQKTSRRSSLSLSRSKSWSSKAWLASVRDQFPLSPSEASKGEGEVWFWVC